MPQLSSRKISALGISTRVFEVGPDDADEAIVFLHGHPGSAEDWLDLLPLVAPFARGVAVDWVAFGEADRPLVSEWDFSAGTYSIFLAAVLAELGIERAHLVMHDLGGVGVMWGAAHPDAFASAVLIDTGILLDFRWHPVARVYRAPVIGDLLALITNRIGFRSFVRFYNPQDRELPPQYVERWFDEYPLATRRAILSFYRATPPAAMERLREPLRDLDVPALVLWGAQDPAVPVEQAERQRESFPSAKVTVFDDSGHWPHLDNPERAAEVIVPFLERQLAKETTAVSS